MLILINRVRTRVLLEHEQEFALYILNTRISSRDLIYTLRDFGPIPEKGLNDEGYIVSSVIGASFRLITKEVLYVKYETLR